MIMIYLARSFEQTNMFKFKQIKTKILSISRSAGVIIEKMTGETLEVRSDKGKRERKGEKKREEREKRRENERKERAESEKRKRKKREKREKIEEREKRE